MATTGGKAYLMVLSDILQLAQSPEYSSHPKQQPEELVGFRVPQWMIEKMKAYIETAKTNPDTTDEELLRMAEEYADMEADADNKQKKVNIWASLRRPVSFSLHFFLADNYPELRVRSQSGLGGGHRD